MDLNINYQETRNTGNNVITQSEEFSNLLSKINNINSQLKGYWQGADATKYSGAVEEQLQYMQQLKETIAEIGEFLIQVGNAYEEAMQRNCDAIK